MMSKSNGRVRVLLVDDDLEYLSWAERTWARRGYHLSTCATVEEARKSLLARTYDAVVSDSVVSPTTGTNALAIAAQVVPGIPRILVSGKDETEVERMAATVCATAWLTKPFNHDALAAALARKPDETPGRSFVWREGALVFVVGPPPDGFAEVERLVGAIDGSAVVVLVDSGQVGAGAVLFAERLLELRGPLRAVGLVSDDAGARQRWSALESDVVTRAFSELAAAVEWAAVRAGMATRLQPREVPDRSPTAARPRVLVVDDDPSLRLLVARFLTKLGAEAVTACHVEEAEELLADDPIDAAIIDKNMPGRSGLDLLRELGDVATVMMTADPCPTSRAEATELGALAYLEKPFALSELEQALSDALAGSVLASGDSTRLQAVTEMLREMSKWAQRRQATSAPRPR